MLSSAAKRLEVDGLRRPRVAQLTALTRFGRDKTIRLRFSGIDRTVGPEKC